MAGKEDCRELMAGRVAGRWILRVVGRQACRQVGTLGFIAGRQSGGQVGTVE